MRILHAESGTLEKISLKGRQVSLSFSDSESALKAYDLLSNAIDLGIPIMIRTVSEEERVSASRANQ